MPTRTPPPPLPLKGTPLRAAIEAALERSLAIKPPHGRWDSAGRWYPSSAEHSRCCSSIRQPSRAWPHSLYKHCWTLSHVAVRYQIDPSDLRRLVNLHRTQIVTPWLPKLNNTARRRLANNGDQQLLELLAHDADTAVRVTVARRSHDPNLLAQMVRDDDSAVRSTVLANRHLPPHLRAVAALAGT